MTNRSTGRRTDRRTTRGTDRIAGRGTDRRAGRPGGAVLLALLALALAACGVKSAPEHPPGVTYPSQYPARGTAADDPAKPKPAPASPQGFPYYYPNQPPSK